MIKRVILAIYNFRRVCIVMLKGTSCSICKLIGKYTNRCRGTFSYFSKPLSGCKVDMERLANALLVVSVRCIAICAFEGGSHTLLKSRYKFAFGSRQEIRYFLAWPIRFIQILNLREICNERRTLSFATPCFHRLFIKFTRNAIALLINLLIATICIFSLQLLTCLTC